MKTKFTLENHRKEAEHHHKIYDGAMRMLEEKRIKNPKFKPSQEAYDFIQKHHRLMVDHTRKANGRDRKGIVHKKFLTMSKDQIVNRINLLYKTGKGTEAKELYTLLENFKNKE